MGITKNRLSSARKTGASDDDLFEIIKEEMPELSDRMSEAYKAGSSKTSIIDAIAEEGTRGTLSDLALQIPVSLVTGVESAPRTMLDVGETAVNLATEPRQTIVNMARWLGGLEPQEAEREIAPLEQLLGKEKFGQLKDALGISAVERGVEAVTGAASKGYEAFKGLFPTAEEVRKEKEQIYGVDLEPTNPLSSVLGTGIERLGQTAMMGPAGALSLAAGGAAGETARQLGAPEYIARPVDVAVSMLRLKGAQEAKGAPIQESAPSGPAGSGPSGGSPSGRPPTIADATIEKLVKSKQPFEPPPPAQTRQITAVSPPRRPDRGAPAGISATETAADLQKSFKEPLLESVYPQDLGREGSIKHLQQAVNKAKTSQRGAISDLYRALDETVGQEQAAINPIRESFSRMTQDLEERGILGTGESELRSVLKSIDEDLEGRYQIIEGEEVMVKPPISTIGDLIRINRQLNDKLTFGITDPAKRQKAVNLLKPFKKDLTNQISRQIKTMGPEPFQLWRRAQAGHQGWAQRYSQDFVVELLESNDYNALAKQSLSAKNIRDATSSLARGDTASRSVLSRLALEELDLAAPTAEITRTWRDLAPTLTPEARSAGNTLLEINNPRSTAGQIKAIGNVITGEINEWAVSGELPTATLKRMNNPRGYNLTRQSLSTTTNGSQAFGLLEDQWINAHVNGMLKRGTIDTSKLKQFVNNSDLMGVYEEITSPAAARYLRDLNTSVDKWDRVFREKAHRAGQPKPKVKAKAVKEAKEPKVKAPTKFADNPVQWANENKAKTALAVMALRSLGVPMKALKIGGGAIAIATPPLAKLLRSTKSLALVNRVGANPHANKNLLINLNRELEKAD